MMFLLEPSLKIFEKRRGEGSIEIYNSFKSNSFRNFERHDSFRKESLKQRARLLDT